MHRLGEITQTTAALLYRATSNVDVYAVVGEQQSETVAADTAVDDGVIRLEVTGLSAGATYNYRIVADGTQVATGTLNTPSNGRLSVAFLSCWAHYKDVGEWVADLMEAHDPPVAAVYFGGDTPYCNGPNVDVGDAYDVFGETIARCNAEINAEITDGGAAIADYDYSNAANKTTIRNIMYPHHRSFHNTPGVKRICEKFSTLWGASDHEWPGNDVDRGDYTTVNTPEDVVANDTQLADMMIICREAFAAYYQGNPANTTAQADGSWGDHKQMYWTSRLSDGVQVFHLDPQWLRDSSAASFADRTCFGADQLTWLENELDASTTDFKIILSPTSAVGGLSAFAEETGAHPQTADGSDNGDRDLLFRLLDNYTGVVVAAGDIHHTFLSTHNGVSVACICPVNATQNTGTASNNAYDTGARWYHGGLGNGFALSSTSGTHNGFVGFLDYEPSENRLYVRYFHRRRAATFTLGYIEKGSNELKFNQVKVA